MKPYTVYKTSNNINGKIYIGVHRRSKRKNDNYIGSGKLIKSAIDKYGFHNFTSEVLFEYDTADEAYAKERELVTPEFVKMSNTYNLIPGGMGGKGKTLSKRHIKIISESKKGIPRSEECKLKMSETRKLRKYPSPNKGKSLSDAHKEALRLAKIKHVIIDNVIYADAKEAANHYGIAVSTVRARIHSKKFSEWKYYDKIKASPK